MSKKEKVLGAKKQEKTSNLLPIILGVVVLVAIGGYMLLGGNTETAVADTDLVMSTAEITDKAIFPKITVKGTEMSLLLIRDTDGQIRTSLNTCEACYRSPLGYYVQEGDLLTCQNCGNKFHRNDIQKVRGGCNPVPVEHTIEGGNVKITKEELGTKLKYFIK